MAYNLPKKKDGIKLDYLPIDWTTKKGRKVVLDEYDVKDEPSLHALFQDTVNVGESYPQDSATLEEFRSYYLTHQVFVVKDSKEGNILGAFYVKPNFPGRSSHICNSGFLVDAICKGEGIGKWMVKNYLRIAADLGYKASFFNLVFEINNAMIRIAQNLGFQQAGRIPKAVKLNDGRYIDAIQFYKEFEVDGTT